MTDSKPEVVYVRMALDCEKEQYNVTCHKSVYVVCQTDGVLMGLFNGSKMAFVAARQNDFAPVWAH